MQGASVSSLFFNKWLGVIGIILIVYLANCFTPLRLTNDTVRYFTLVEDMKGEWPADFGQPHDFLPYGYVYFLAGLSYVHLLNSFGIAFFQLLYLCGSLYFIIRLFGVSIKVWPFVFFTLLNWTTFKYVMTPLSEMQFLFFSTAALFFYQRFMDQRKVWLLFVTVILCFVCFITRTAGIALILALLSSFLISIRKSLVQKVRAYPVYGVVGIALVGTLLVFLLTRPKVITYFSYFFGPLFQDPVHFFVRNIRWHLTDWAELFINVPVSKTGFLISKGLAELFYMLAGLFFGGVLMTRLVRNRRLIPLPVTVYVIIYSVLIFNWPFSEARFWFPLVPFLAAILLQHKPKDKTWLRNAWVTYAMYYVVTGVFVLGYYTRISFDREYLMKRHDAGKWQHEYEVHFGRRKSTDAVELNKKALYILDKYD